MALDFPSTAHRRHGLLSSQGNHTDKCRLLGRQGLKQPPRFRSPGGWALVSILEIIWVGVTLNPRPRVRSTSLIPRTEPTCLPCFMTVGLAAVWRWLELTNPLVPKRPRRAEGTFREAIWYCRGFRLPMPPPTELAVGRELDCPKPRL